jgi:hypothetical protein
MGAGIAAMETVAGGKCDAAAAKPGISPFGVGDAFDA